ncbi:MAG TPA: MATE family efflux transporter [Xanthomonadales bacterium]|nr:MATE family efflux transporter [Xanthomonadales bacterium]
MLETRLKRLAGESRATLALALPVVVAQLLSVAMNVADTVLAGHLDTRVLAAVAMGYQVWVLALLVVIGLMLAVTPAIAQLDGAGRRGETGAVFRQALWIALAIGVGLFLAMYFGAPPLLEAFGVAPAIRDEALGFLRAIAWGAYPLAIFFACKNFSEGLSLTRPGMYFSILALVLLVPLAWVLMYGRLGLPALGARGAGIAHATVLWVQALAFLAYVARRRHYRAAQAFVRFDPPSAREIGALLRVGVPMGVSIFMEGSLFVATALLVGRLGEVPAAAHQIAISCASVTFMLPLGIGMATTVRVGNAVGRQDPSGIAWAGAAGLALALVTQFVSAALMLLVPGAIVAAYTADTAVAALAVTLLGYAALFQFSDGVQALFNGALRGLKDTAVPAVITILAYWGVGMPLGWWLGIERGGGAAGLWSGLIAGLSVAALLLTLRFVLMARRFRRLGVPQVAAATP